MQARQLILDCRLRWGTSPRLIQPRPINLCNLLFSQHTQGFMQNVRGASILRRHNPVVHPLSLTPRGNHAGTPQVGQMPRNLGLTLPEYLNEIADTEFAAVHQVEQTQAGAIRERGKEQGQIKGFGGGIHTSIIYVLTDMSS